MSGIIRGTLMVVGAFVLMIPFKLVINKITKSTKQQISESHIY